MACATSLVKFILFGFNFLIVLGGAGLITIGALALSGFEEYHEYVDLSAYKAAPITTIVFGSIVFIIAFLGCCGVLRENNCMMITYAVFLGIILLVQIGVVVAAHVYRDDFEKILKDGFELSRQKYVVDKEVTANWDELQRNLKCCGTSSYNDWYPQLGFVPESCCVDGKTGCKKGTQGNPSAEIYQTGCVHEVLNKLSINRIVWPVAIVVAVELLGIIFGCCLAARFRHSKYRGRG